MSEDWNNESWCMQCGLCCKYYDIMASVTEFENIAIALPADVLEELKNKVRLLDKDQYRLDEDHYYWLNPCPMLEEISETEYRCMIYSIRPKICKAFSEAACQRTQQRFATNFPYVFPIELKEG